jgi:hypothetical protein
VIDHPTLVLQLACMGRFSGLTREELTEKLYRHASKEMIEEAVNQAFSITESDLSVRMDNLSSSLKRSRQFIEAGKGVGVDANGLDAADRISIRISIHAMETALLVKEHNK